MAIIGSIGFLVLATLAMLAYPGGTPAEPAATHYQFFHNPFSDLGRTRTFAGHRNAVAMPLFVAAMVAGGTGLGALFIAFAVTARHTVVARTLSRVAAGLGVIAGLCFVGVGCTPWDLYMRPHMHCVFAAFRSLLLATLLDTLAVPTDGRLPNRLMVPFLAFGALLAGYIVILTAGLSGGAVGDAVVQATGQKAIAIAAMVMVLVQAGQLRRSSFR